MSHGLRSLFLWLFVLVRDLSLMALVWDISSEKFCLLFLKMNQ